MTGATQSARRPAKHLAAAHAREVFEQVAPGAAAAAASRETECAAAQREKCSKRARRRAGRLGGTPALCSSARIPRAREEE